MALQISYEDQFGVTHGSAYCRIVKAILDLEANTVDVEVGIWTTEANRTANKEKILREGVRLTITPGDLGATPAAAAYTNLQTIGRYVGAIDV